MMTPQNLQEEINLAINKARPNLTLAQIQTVVADVNTAIEDDATPEPWDATLYTPQAALAPNMGNR